METATIEIPSAVDEVKPPWIPDAVYDTLRYSVEFIIPAMAIAYAGLATLWGFPNSAQIVGTLGVIGVLIGSVIKVNQKRARNVAVAEKFDEGVYLARQAQVTAELDATRIAGDIILGTGDESAGLVTLALDKPISEFEDRDEISLRVKKLHTNGLG